MGGQIVGTLPMLAPVWAPYTLDVHGSGGAAAAEEEAEEVEARQARSD